MNPVKNGQARAKQAKRGALVVTLHHIQVRWRDRWKLLRHGKVLVAIEGRDVKVTGAAVE